MSVITAEGTGYVKYAEKMHTVPTLYEKGKEDSHLFGASPASTAAFEQGDVDGYLDIIGPDARHEIEDRAAEWARFCAMEAKIALANRLNKAQKSLLEDRTPIDQNTDKNIYKNDRT